MHIAIQKTQLHGDQILPPSFFLLNIVSYFLKIACTDHFIFVYQT